jgi:hypothetical protein
VLQVGVGNGLAEVTIRAKRELGEKGETSDVGNALGGRPAWDVRVMIRAFEEVAVARAEERAVDGDFEEAGSEGAVGAEGGDGGLFSFPAPPEPGDGGGEEDGEEQGGERQAEEVFSEAAGRVGEVGAGVGGVEGAAAFGAARGLEGEEGVAAAGAEDVGGWGGGGHVWWGVL